MLRLWITEGANVSDTDHRLIPHRLWAGDSHHAHCEAGRSGYGTAPFFDVERRGHGILLAVGWSGQWQGYFDRTTDALRIRSGIMYTSFRLHPGESFRTSSVVLLEYRDGQAAAHNVWRRYLRERVSPIGQSGGARGTQCPFSAIFWGGISTEALLRRGTRVTAIEKDPALAAWLRESLCAEFPDALTLIPGDALRVDWPALLGQGFDAFASNLPYSVGTRILMELLAQPKAPPRLTLLLQREVAERIACPPGSKEYGILSVLLQAWYDIEYLFTVGEKVFNPPPKVKSAVIRLRRNGVVRLACDERLFVRVVKASFGQRRKMLRNSLRAAFGDFGGAEHPFFSQRAEQLSVADFVALTQWVEQRIGG